MGVLMQYDLSIEGARREGEQGAPLCPRGEACAEVEKCSRYAGGRGTAHRVRVECKGENSRGKPEKLKKSGALPQGGRYNSAPEHMKSRPIE